jgi:hypothetical protein
MTRPPDQRRSGLARSLTKPRPNIIYSLRKRIYAVNPDRCRRNSDNSEPPRVSNLSCRRTVCSLSFAGSSIWATRGLLGISARNRRSTVGALSISRGRSSQFEPGNQIPRAMHSRK